MVEKAFSNAGPAALENAHPSFVQCLFALSISTEEKAFSNTSLSG